MLKSIALSCLLVTSLACVSTSTPFGKEADNPWGGRTSIDLKIRIQNDHYEPVRVFAVWEEMDFYFGEITPGSTQQFQLPGYLLESQGGPRFLADPVGSAQELLTAPVECVGARMVEWRIRRNFHASRPRVL